MSLRQMVLPFFAAVVMAVPAYAQTAAPGPDPSGQYAPLHPVAPASPGSVAVLPDMPQAHTQGDITFVSGGISGEQRQAMREATHNYNLHLLFAIGGTGDYLSDVKVQLVDKQGVIVLDAVSDGPYFMARVPPGRYRITADLGGRSQTRAVTVPARGTSSQSFFWQS